MGGTPGPSATRRVSPRVGHCRAWSREGRACLSCVASHKGTPVLGRAWPPSANCPAEVAWRTEGNGRASGVAVEGRDSGDRVGVRVEAQRPAGQDSR